MKSRKDQVQAYFFVVGRLAAAVTHGEPDALQAPSKRLSTGTVFGILIALLLMGIFGVYGLFSPGKDNSWRTAGAIVMDETTGARYVYLDGQLRPVLNYSSARLAAGRGDGKVVGVSPGSLAGTPVGQPIGIPGAPDALPAGGQLSKGSWTVCVDVDTPDHTGPQVTLLLGAPPGRAVADRQAVLAQAPDGAHHLLWNGKRLRIAEPAALEALGYGGKPAVKVSAPWLNAVTPGPDLRMPDTGGAGGQGPVIDGRPSRVGQVYEVRNRAIGTDQLYLVRSGGVVPINRTVAALVLSAPGTRAAYPDAVVAPVEAGAGALAGVPVQAGADLGAGLPSQPPEVVPPPSDSLPCTAFTPSADGSSVSTVEFLSANVVRSSSVPTAPHKAGSAADRVSIPAGAGALVRTAPAAGATAGTLYLVTEVGTRFPLPSKEALSALGYSENATVAVPAALVALLPAGPVLSTEAARVSQGGTP
ncbi:type VII secretion protein EccB [Lentzea cavernae]|uniref:Type VII secretion protein EccB n=1 Tax=Lentzea cavernae TaxID=2020703 RepID=A0ABQ3MWD9_9PSEU|nr:type VII secretion protein EccB [Lentzea cavernae]GHH56501.1 type VII secretion protein EccB [Lentzea cavernae]